MGNQNAGEYNQYIYALNNPNKYKDPSGHFNIAEAFSVAFSIAKKEARKQIDYAVKTAGKTLDWVGNITGLKGTTSYIKKTINTQVKKVNKIMDKVVAQAQKNAAASKKKSQQRQQKNNFISYAQKHGIEEAYRKYKGMDSRLLEEAVKAYCEKLGLEYISVADALKTVAKVEKGLSLLSKYTTICETIKHTGNVNEDAVKSSVGYSRESSINKVYLSKAVSLLDYTRNQASNYPHATGSVTSSVNARIGTIYSYSYGTSQLTSEYVSSMTSHSKDMMNYIWSESGEYIGVKVWVDTGRYSGGYFEKAVYHKDSKQYQAYGNWFYETFVPGGANVQAHADKLEFLAGIAGAANQSYNPYTGPVNHATNPQGPSTGNETYKDTNSSIGNTGQGSIGNTGQGSIGNSTSPSGQVTQGNSTTNGYTEPGNTNPGYVAPSVSNGIGTGTVQGSGSAFGEMSSEDTVAYNRYWAQVKSGLTPEQRYDLKVYYDINGTNNYTINIQTGSKVDIRGMPNTITRRIDNNGNIISDRIYDSNGKVLRDIDYDQHGNPGKHPYAPHIHDWINGVRQK